MTITLEYFAQARDAAGTRSERVDVAAGCIAQDFLRELAAARGGTLTKLLLDGEGRLSATVLIAVNGVQIRRDPPLPLKDGDVITIIPPVSGG